MESHHSPSHLVFRKILYLALSCFWYATMNYQTTRPTVQLTSGYSQMKALYTNKIYKISYYFDAIPSDILIKADSRTRKTIHSHTRINIHLRTLTDIHTFSIHYSGISSLWYLSRHHLLSVSGNSTLTLFSVLLFNSICYDYI